MEVTALLLSRLQFAFTISFHIIFPSFSIGLAAWLTILEALYQATGRPAYRVVFEFWLKIFSVAFGMGVVSGIVMAFQFGTNWEVLARMVGPIQGVLLSYETFTAFFLEASFFGDSLVRALPRAAVVLFVLDRDGRARHHAVGLLDHGEQQLDAGTDRLRAREWRLRPDRLGQNRLQSSAVGRFPRMCSLLHTGAFCVAATGAWYLLRGKNPGRSAHHAAHGPVPRGNPGADPDLFGHLNGDYVHDYQPAKFAAIEARWHDEQPAGEVLIAIPDTAGGAQPLRNQGTRPRQPDPQHELGFEGSSGYRFSARGSASVLIPFFAFRIMVGSGLIMLALAWIGSYLSLKERLERSRLLLWAIFLSFPLPFIAILTGWFTAEVGRQPWTVLWRVAHRGIRHSVSDDARGARLSDRLLPGLYIHFRLRCRSILSTAAYRSGRASG